MSSAKSTQCALALLSVAWALAAASHGLAHSEDAATLEVEALTRALDAPALQEARARMAALTRAEPFDGQRVQALLADPSVDAIGRDHLRLTLVNVAREHEAPGAALITYVRQLAMHEDEVLVWHEEGPLAIPYFAIASAAKGTLALWQRRRVAAELTDAFARGETPTLRAYFQHGHDAHARRAGALDALRALPPGRLAALSQPLLAALDEDASVEAPLALIARETADHTLFRRLAVHGRTREVLPLLRAAVHTLAPADAFEVLIAAHGNERYCSPALYAMAPLLDRTPGVRDYLSSALADGPSGGSAAAVIAASADRTLLDAVAAQLADPTLDDRHHARLVLTLRLADSTSTRSQLRASLDRGEVRPAHLAQEVRSWLGE